MNQRGRGVDLDGAIDRWTGWAILFVIALGIEMLLHVAARAWRRARWVGAVRYYAARGATTRGLIRAIERGYATDRIDVRAVDEVLSRAGDPGGGPARGCEVRA